METQILQYDLLWIQSIPSISYIYYLKYLKETHVIHCPDKDLSIRAIARSIMSTIRFHETKKTALYFEQPCSETKRKSIFEFVLKHVPNLTCYCLSVPCAPLQPSLLLGWSAGLTDNLWKKLCSAAYDPEAFMPFQPPTANSGQSTCNEFDTMFAMSATKFSGEALFVHFTNNLLSFDADQGLVLSENVENAIQGWIEASQHQFKTLIWIIDEKKLYGDTIYNINQKGRDALLQKYRQLVSDRVESFNTAIPVYCYILDYFHGTCFNLLHYLTQLQHRHNLNLAGSTLLTWSKDETESLDHQSFYILNCIYLQQKPLFNVSKWKYIHQSSDTSLSKDQLKYVSPDLLQLDDDLTNVYRIPLLKRSDNCLPLTKSEQLTYNIRHTVSAKTVEIFNSWADLSLKQNLEPITDQDAIPSTWNDAGVEPFEAKESPDKDHIHKKVLQNVISSLTEEKINASIGNVAYIERGLELKRQVTQLSVNTEDDEHVQMVASIPIESSSGFITSTIFFSKHNETYKLIKAKCTCPIGNWGNCKHCTAVMLHALDQRVSSQPGNKHCEDEPSPPLLTKRSYDASEEDNSSSSYESRKKANSSVESYQSTSTVAYDPNTPPSAPTSHSTDEEGVTQLTFASNVSSISDPSLRSFGVVSSSNERSSHSLSSLSSGAKEMIFLESSNSLSDNQQLKESLEQIQESQNEEEESVEITEQVNFDLRTSPTCASHIDQTRISPTKKQEESSNLTNVEKQESNQNDDEEEDYDDLPDTQPCF